MPAIWVPIPSARPDGSDVAAGKAEHFRQYCVNCGTRLESRKCRLICPRCGFYHSCGEP
ncbi:MAG TPA: hypothetical protein VJO14_05780 [Bacteroidota bacterium]|nr:hypothetical protein [Bacteroidota bacterium]